jgi:hypothetical protein
MNIVDFAISAPALEAVGSAATAGLTAIAVLVACFTYLHERGARRSADEARKQEQANCVNAWTLDLVETDGNRMRPIRCQNDSELPVFNVHTWIPVGKNCSGDQPPAVVNASYRRLLLPKDDGWVRNVRVAQTRKGALGNAGVAFRDFQGQHWWKSSNGTLHELSAADWNKQRSHWRRPR